VLLSHSKRIDVCDKSPRGDKSIPRVSKWLRFLSQLKEYLSFLMDKGLIDEILLQTKSSGNKRRYVYKTTEKGLRFLQISREVESIMDQD
jgi:hypothetical protein